MIGGCARVIRDVPPFVMLDGDTAMVVGLNKVGLRRAGFTASDMLELKAAYRVIYRSGLMWQEMLDTLRAGVPDGTGRRVRAVLPGRQARLRARTPHAAGRDRSPPARRCRRHDRRTAATRKESRLIANVSRGPAGRGVFAQRKRALPVGRAAFGIEHHARSNQPQAITRPCGRCRCPIA